MIINSLNSQALEKICSYLQDADLKAFLKAFEKTSEKVQTVARNELENRDKELERLLSPYEAPRTFNITTLKEANLFLVGDTHCDEQYLLDRSALIYFLARRGPVVFVMENKPSMQKCNALATALFGTKRVFQLQPQSLNPSFKENIHAIGWDDMEELRQFDHAIDQKYSELEKPIEYARISFIQQLPDELRLSDSEWTELWGILFSNYSSSYHINHYFSYLLFSAKLYKLRKTEKHIMRSVNIAKHYFKYLDSIKRNLRTEDFEYTLKNLVNNELEEKTINELEVLVENKSGIDREFDNDLRSRYKTNDILNSIIEVFELYDKVENLLEIQPASLELEQQIQADISKLILDIIFYWNLIGIEEQLPLKLPLIKISNFSSLSEDLPISMLMNKLRFFRTTFLQNLPVKALKELLSHLDEYNAINEQYINLISSTEKDRLDAIIKTFPIRTRSMATTLSKIDNYIFSLGLQQSMTVLVAGYLHLINNEPSSEYDLSPLYEELTNHKAAILIPSGIRVDEKNSEVKPEPAATP